MYRPRPDSAHILPGHGRPAQPRGEYRSGLARTEHSHRGRGVGCHMDWEGDTARGPSMTGAFAELAVRFDDSLRNRSTRAIPSATLPRSHLSSPSAECRARVYGKERQHDRRCEPLFACTRALVRPR